MLLDPALLETGRSAAAPNLTDDLLVLPGFDEYLLGFKDRSLMLDSEHRQAIIPGGNGVFQPTVVRGGRVIGTWKRSVGRKQTVIAVRPLVPLGAPDRVRVEEAFQPYARFHGQDIVVRWP